MSERHKAAALKRGANRTAKTLRQVEDAILVIGNEMAANGGIYPLNGGTVSMAELARRAGINESTFYKKDNMELKERAALWLVTLKNKDVVGRKRVRETFQQRAKNWKEKYEALQNRHIVTELQMQQLQAEHEKLRRNYEALLEQIKMEEPSRVTPFPK